MLAQIKKLALHLDDRGYLYEILRNDDDVFTKFGQYYVSVTNPGVIKGFHLHHKQTDFVACVHGQVKLVLVSHKGEVEEHHLSPLDPKLIVIPPETYHGWMCVGGEEAIIINATDYVHDHSNPDEERVDPHNNPWGYVWGVVDR